MQKSASTAKPTNNSTPEIPISHIVTEIYAENIYETFDSGCSRVVVEEKLCCSAVIWQT